LHLALGSLLHFLVANLIEKRALEKAAGGDSEVRVELIHVAEQLREADIRLAVLLLPLDLRDVVARARKVKNVAQSFLIRHEAKILVGGSTQQIHDELKLVVLRRLSPEIENGLVGLLNIRA